MTKINIFLFKTQRNNKIKLVKQVLSREETQSGNMTPCIRLYPVPIR